MPIDNIFIDTSAFYALMDRSDRFHKEAVDIWHDLLDEGLPLKTSNYILIETLALLQNRLGFHAADLWSRDILSIVDILWTDQAQHNVAFEIWYGLGRRKLSFVDCSSFVAMRQKDINKVFTFDKHFSEHGFEILAAA